MLTQTYAINREPWACLDCQVEAILGGAEPRPKIRRASAKSQIILTNSIIGRLEITHVKVPTLIDVREAAGSSNSQDDYFMSVLLDGAGVFKGSRRTIIQAKNEIVLCHANSGFSYHFGPEAILVKIPKSLLISRCTDIEDLSFPVGFGHDLALNGLLADVIKGAMSVELTTESSAIVGGRLASSVVELISAVIASDLERTRAQRSGRQTKLERAQIYIEANLSNEELTPDRIARYAGVSLRTLNRLFAEVQTTPMRWVWQRRLDACHIALVGGTGKSVADVAFRFGFRELSHFSRSFKAAYGKTPAQIAKPPSRT